MLNLVINEWVKIFKQVGTYIMLALIVLLAIGNGLITTYFVPEQEAAEHDWRVELTAEINQWKEELSNDEMFMPASIKKMAEKEIALNEYRLEHNLAPEASYSAWQFLSESAVFTSIVGLFVIIVAAGIVANEFSWGTIKMMLVRPFYRWKFLAAKYVTVLLFMACALALLFVSMLIVGFTMFGTGGSTDHIHLTYVNNTVIENNFLVHLIKMYLFNSLSIFFLATMAFMISAVFRISGLAIGISLFLLLMGGQVTGLLASKFSWAKYILFANTNLMQYIDGSPMVEGMTMSFSIMMLVIYFVVMQLLAFFLFTKRDVAN